MSRISILLGTITVLYFSYFVYVDFVSAPNLDTIKPFSDISFVSKESADCVDDSITEIDYLYYDISKEKRENNKFGLYAYAENRDFIKLTADLVNSNGGDWGYILLPYNVSDRDFDKWVSVFELLYKKHLIPIIQLNALDIDNYKNQTKEASEFLDNFIWPVKERYVSVYNEPNSADFWFGHIDAKEYAEVLNYTIDTFKATDSDFFMLNGALNASAPNAQGYQDSFDFMYEMNKEVPGIFEKLDGWASHSYPQPNFSGSPVGYGRYSVRAYASELEYLKSSLDIKKDLPVFITETGWVHAEGANYNSSYFTSEKIGEFFKTAFTKVWLPDDRVVAVVPFTIWYDPPFDHFSWVNQDKVPYKHFEMVKSLSKVAGKPNHLVSGTLKGNTCFNQKQQ